MCGIFITITPHNQEISEDFKEIIDLVNLRGPNGFHTVEILMKHVKLKIHCSVLHLRGKGDPTLQPLVNDKGDVLCWNGEVWNGLNMELMDNDTLYMMNVLSEPSTSIFDVIKMIQGPYAFVYLDRSKEKLWYGRDCLGRRSLLKRKSSEKDTFFYFLLSSVSNGDPLWEEVCANGLYYIDLSTIYNKLEEINIPYVYDFNQLTGLYLTYPFPRINTSIEPVDAEKLNLYVDEFYDVLKQALYVRTASIPSVPINQSRLAILYSGGLDSSVLARIIHEIFPEDEPIDLLNIAFENPRVLLAQEKQNSIDLNSDDVYNCADRIAGLNAYKELCEITGNKRPWRFVQVNIPYSESINHKSTIIKLMHPNDTVMDLSISMAFYFVSRGQGFLRCSDNSLVKYNSVSKVLISGEVY